MFLPRKKGGGKEEGRGERGGEEKRGEGKGARGSCSKVLIKGDRRPWEQQRVHLKPYPVYPLHSVTEISYPTFSVYFVLLLQ